MSLATYRSKKFKLTTPVKVIVGVLLCVSLFAILELIGVTNLLDKPDTDKKTTNQLTTSDFNKGEQTNNSTSNPNDPYTPSTSPNGKDDNNTAQKILVEPSGTFVSNHSPNISGAPLPNKLQSTCSTTPGATCYIQFTKDGITKSTAKQTVDSGGGAYWSWTLNELGLTEGSWSVEAIATLGDQTKTSKDGITLEVRP